MEILIYLLIPLIQIYFFKFSLLSLIGSILLIMAYKIFVFPSKKEVDQEMNELRSIISFCNFYLVNLEIQNNLGYAVKETTEQLEMVDTHFIKKIKKITKESSSFNQITKEFIKLLDSYDYDFIKLFSSNLKVANEKGITNEILEALEESSVFSEARYLNWLQFFTKKEFMWKMSIFFTFAILGLVILFSVIFKDVYILFINNILGIISTEVLIFLFFIPDLLASKSYVKKNLFEGVIDE